MTTNSIQVHHGDCAELLPGLNLQANLILTSPPYDHLRHYGGDEFHFPSVADACVASLAPHGVLVWVVGDATIDGSETGTSFRQALGFLDRGLLLHDTMIFQKRAAGSPSKYRYYQSFELMLVFSKGSPAVVNLIVDRPNSTASRQNKKRRLGFGRKKDRPNIGHAHDWQTPDLGVRTNVWTYDVGGIRTQDDRIASRHPARFPLLLAKDHIRSWTNPGDLILDPMAGSGTTLRAALDLNRHSVGIDTNEEYIHVINQRVAQRVLVPFPDRFVIILEGSHTGARSLCEEVPSHGCHQV